MNAEFEGNLLLFRAVLPIALAMLVAWLFAKRLTRTRRLAEESQVQESGTEVTRGFGFVGLGCIVVWIAFVVSDFASRGILVEPSLWSTWEAKEPWMHWVWIGPLVLSLWVVSKYCLDSLVQSPMCPTEDGVGSRRCNVLTFRGLTWVGIVALTLGVISLAMFPGGPGYLDQLARFRLLGLLALVGSIVNVEFVEIRQEATESHWFGWVHWVHTVCIAAVVLQSYASLGEWMIFSASMLCGTLISGALCGQVSSNKPLSFLLGFAACGGLCVSEAYAWNHLPTWLLVMLLGLPSWVSLADVLVSRLTRESFWIRLCVAVGLMLAMVATICFFVLRSEPQW